MTYLDFLSAKRAKAATEGTTVDPDALHPRLFDWQREIVSWAIGVGRAAIWADTGLGKTMMQLEWAKHSGATALIVAVKNGRRAISCELKPSYWQAAVNTMRDLDAERSMPSLMDELGDAS